MLDSVGQKDYVDTCVLFFFFYQLYNQSLMVVFCYKVRKLKCCKPWVRINLS